MIRATSPLEGPSVTINASWAGLAIYLDHFALMDLAEGEAKRRQRFLSALRSKEADLLFSVTNAADLTGPLGNSLAAARDFLDEIGPHWFPVELDTFEVIERERRGATRSQCCLSERFLKDHLNNLTNDPPNPGSVVNLRTDFFLLGSVLDWVGRQRESIREGMRELDNVLFKKVAESRVELDGDPLWLDRILPASRFEPSRPAEFARNNLLRTLILEAKTRPLKKGDGVDFSHAVMASAFANIAMLDKHWKRRVENLPKPNKLARIYFAPELGKMVSDIESFLSSPTRLGASNASG